ncbi:retinol dehydrogenase 13-like [Leptopilina heterotoma]|uniref:retinol dehydrogenase 13-like n=1 Tax=Leptopilina heterotoma TaxID=63436 RepID=UPI001CA94D53|nr:retinol dehydrogenase 13-like [Leptopilina heterotoma]
MKNEILWIIVACICCIAVLLTLFKIYNKLTVGVCKSDKRLDEQVIIVTGANTGIGKETALDFARRGAKVILACRDLVKAHKAKEEIVEITKNRNVVVRHLDLASLKSVRKFASEIIDTESRLDVLVNNAGVGTKCLTRKPRMVSICVYKSITMDTFY